MNSQSKDLYGYLLDEDEVPDSSNIETTLWRNVFCGSLRLPVSYHSGEWLIVTKTVLSAVVLINAVSQMWKDLH